MARTKALLVLFTIGAAWGLTIPLGKIAVSTGHGAAGLIVWELVIAIAILAAGGLWRLNIRLTAKRLRLFAVVAAMGTLAPQYASYIAAAELPAGVMAIVIAIAPMFALPIAIALRLERPALRRGVGVLLGGAAVVVLVGPEASLPDSAKVGFVFVALIAPVCYAVESNYIAWRTTDGLNPAEVLFGASILGLAVVAPIAIVTGTWISPIRPWNAPEWSLVGLAALHVVAYWSYIWLINRAGAVFSSQVAYLVTGTGVLWSILILSEVYSGWIWAALGLMLAGIAMVRPRGGRAETPRRVAAE